MNGLIFYALISMVTCDHFINEFVVHVSGGEKEARIIALQTGFSYHGPVSYYGSLLRV